ncbi:hypothetical protein Hanom_Chr05g00420561 [Helianthus anomalus]
MYVKELKRVAIKREHGIQYFNSLMSILSLPHYDVSTLTQIRVLSCSNDFVGNLFEKKIRFKKWMDGKTSSTSLSSQNGLRFVFLLILKQIRVVTS